jgi:hypothetical protein
MSINGTAGKLHNEDLLKSPEIQDIILSTQIGCIAAELSERLDISPSRALSLFYESQTCADLHDKRTGLYLYGNKYIADEFILEYQRKQD